ncbi:type II toxin-antitoxin system VapC family toxin [Waterburya agarophytonicola K14]|uniref:Type II toxin-antitoxin system VapC family toxin n=1 Tax=Waterburya agarophytonicola KI4 TaxID=2874699 RepID=A0A964FH86_9CYAN|nr:type II toxin-antitoxin system VapC family toxin [Waterburya agarophytonicola KI4]
MAERSQRNKSNLALVQNFLEGIQIYPIDEETAIKYGEIKASIFKQFAPKEKSKRRKTKMINLGFGENDLWIAATALQHNLIVVSSDSDFQRIKEVEKALIVESWV